MAQLARWISLAALALIIFPCLAYFAGRLQLDAVKWLALFGSLLWFAATPLWMGRKLPLDADQVEI